MERLRCVVRMRIRSFFQSSAFRLQPLLIIIGFVVSRQCEHTSEATDRLFRNGRGVHPVALRIALGLRNRGSYQ